MNTNLEEKQTLKIAFVDFWELSPQEKGLYFSIFKKYFKIIEDPKKPDILFYSCFGEDHLNYHNCIKIFYSGENIVPDFNICDYAISTVKIKYDDRCLWIPQAHWASHLAKDIQPEINNNLTNRSFCSFIYSQDSYGKGAKFRKYFCEQLMKIYKKVDCPGKILHNMESSLLSNRYNINNWHESKIEFLKNYKFNIAFENSEAPGYITEKLVDCYMANTVPIYWGSAGKVYPYPKQSMICANDYPSINALIERIREVDQDDNLYLSILKANPFRKENSFQLPDFQEQIYSFVYKIASASHNNDNKPAPMTDAFRCHIYKKILNKPIIKAVLHIEHLIHKLKSEIKKFYVRSIKFLKYPFK